MIKISMVSYMNTLPLVYGLKYSKYLSENSEIQLDIPSLCAKKVISGEVDLGLIPVAVIPFLKQSYVLPNYCIGSKNKVASVLLLSEKPLSEIETVLLDYQSRTSVNLTRVLAREFWKINPIWKNAKEGFEKEIKGTTAGVVIGDRTFDLIDRFPYVYDLSEEWYKFKKLPFVFAAWVSNKPLSDEFIFHFSKAMEFGIKHTKESIIEYKTHNKTNVDLEYYLNYNIDYKLDSEKQKALNLFLDYLKK